MRKNFYLVMSMAIVLTHHCATSEPAQPKIDPIAELNAELKPARVSGYDLGSSTPSKSRFSEWEKNYLPVIKSVYDRMPEGYKLQIRGNADASGSNQENMEIGQKRAKGIYEFLLKKGFKTDRMVVVSKGEERLMEGEANPFDEDHRRVNFRVIK